ncbi:MAG: acyl-CoA dehydrogenase family protein [Alphaproteobacteria bacterium]|nr:acyl-CoA dehydrogenase family protein [Alphaproteobacteria bacterium]
MSKKIDLGAVLNTIGPQFSAIAAHNDANDEFVAANYDTLTASKLFSAMVPVELGGGGASHPEMCAFLRGLAEYCPSTALALSMHQHVVGAQVTNYRAGRPGQKLLERVAAGEVVLVSTGGNDWLESNGTVTRTDGGFRVSAKKPFASGSPKGGLLVTSAPFEDPVEGWQVLHFGVSFSADGVTLGNDWKAMGMRATGSHTVTLDNVFVPDETVSLRRPRGDYHMSWNVILTVAMSTVMSVYMGVACAAATITEAEARKRAGAPETQYLLGELRNLMTTAELAVDDMVRIANDFDFDPVVGTADAILRRKTIATNAIIAAVEKMLEVAGGGGFYRKLGLEKLLRDVHAARYHPLAEKKQHRFSGRIALGLDPISERDETALLPVAAE